uniref:Endonuclease/exonuclease/phosphatase domain-containing protein n=1 Tax=viral metagenome TaxID=1070528 RepID=A0A6C0DSK6_9ZZZZ
MDFPDESQEHRDCPENVPVLCGKKTLSRGLCVGTRDECKTRKQGVRAILKLPENTAGRDYGYVSDFLGRGCYVPTASMKIDYQRSYRRFDSVPDTFSLLTYNIWGLPKPKLKRLFNLRKPLLINTLNGTDADMFCLQEMSHMAYTEMAEWIDQYAFASEVPFPVDTERRNRSVEVYFVSRYRPKKITVYGITGVLGYENSLLVVEYPNLTIFNMYSQAGSKHSVGQEKTWIHYSRCRYDIMNMIYDMLPKGEAAVICGDFNFHLDGTEAEWPEMEMIRRFETAGFVDTYRKIHRVGGLTEDTDTNLMRWNQKLMAKKYRYDGILYRPGDWSVVGSQVIGKDLVYLNEANSEWFYDEISEAHRLGGRRRLRGVRQTRKGMRLPINASDHFGVLTKFRVRHGAKTRKVRR